MKDYLNINQKQNKTYSNNYDIKEPNFCKIFEFCLLFIIFSIKGNEYNKNILDFFSITDKTLKQMLIFSIIKNDQSNQEMRTF